MRYAWMIIVLGALLWSCEKEISPVQAQKFVKFYGSALMDEAGEVVVLNNGGYAICGTVNLSGSGRRMALIVADVNGNMLSGYPLYYTEDGLESGATSLLAVQGGTGGFFISGFVEKPVDGTQNVQKDVFVVRTSASGELTWMKSYGSPEDEQVLHSVKRIGSGFLLAGSQLKNGKSDIMVMGVTENGDSIRLGLNYNNPFAENATANYLLNTGSNYLCVCTIDKTNDDGTDIYVLSFNNELSPLELRLSGELDEFGRCIVQESSNQFLVLGSRDNASGKKEMVIHSIDKDGLFIKNAGLVATISESNADLMGERIVKTADGRYAIVGTRMLGSNGQMILQFLSHGYSVQEQLSYGASGIQAGRDIDLGRDRGIVLLGTNGDGSNRLITLIKTSETGDL